jgi:mono/diheme cytochrome c family protein
MRLLEPFAQDDKSVRDQLGKILLKISRTASIDQILQLSLTAHVLDKATLLSLMENVATQCDTSALIRDAMMSSLCDSEFDLVRRLWDSPSWKESGPGKEIFLEMLTGSIVRKGDAKEISSLLTFLDANASDFGWKEKTLLTGISVHGKTKMKPIRLASAPDILVNRSTEDEQLQILAGMFEWPGHVVDTARVLSKTVLDEKEQKQFVSGRQFYLTMCANCHGTDGKGLSRFAPPLIGSEWVLGDEKRLSLILLHGLEGPLQVNGKHYDVPEILPVMPSHSTMDDGAIADILTYIRNEWGNNGGAVSPRTVGMTRVMSQGRVMPWTVAELEKHMTEMKTSEEK